MVGVNDSRDHPGPGWRRRGFGHRISTANGKLNVVDPDDGQSFFVAVADRPGTYGTFSIDANGNWVYSLNNNDPRVQGLGAGELTETFTVTTADGTTGTVTITINGTNDVPTISAAAGDVRKTAR